ncbi:ATP-dependent helicase HrpB [Thioalkalivibrio sulfidiphilus]|uniref:ATP-dependent helicase protein, putative n=1 Tax=Thioalkalivibrio sulfidiphilus (strain HL-EbGR7) TaxID=396588 RepID=B8GMC6_THISH|nr:ATP-dependent helicase HrpB [Thioalkalivibrio sulfidiphilus]ACL71758.1 ATP-dependent helicase protein, putative [Thioalkalivibrio sulfidiphilus HL-EbGr7]
MRVKPKPLPVETSLPELQQALASRGMALLQAPPGAGKTTRVPPALLESPWCTGRILLLEPRRLAARAAARRMAAERGERPGETVGLTTRLDRLTGPQTRIEVITEGILTRRLQRDPSLEGVSAVIFDEFHERSLQADLGLALCLQARELLHPELRLLVMSATLDATGVARLMGDAPVITSEGRSYTVDIHYRGPAPEPRAPAPAVTAAVTDALAHHPGDLLVFLPGRREIEQVARALEGRTGAGTRIRPLYGQLPPEAQDAAITPAPEGERKVVLATDIAETSLTIEGIRVVVDSGLARRPVFDPRTGLTRLATVRISQASAEQRRGRAGRLGPGVCIRLWNEEATSRMRPHTPPEILEADLAPLALTLACWGAEADELAWLDAPPAAPLDQGRELLQGLGALDETFKVTDHGRALDALGTHPRLGHMLLGARDRGLGHTACLLAALQEERDPLPRDAGSDLRLRLQALTTPRGGHGGALKRIRTQAGRWMKQLDIRSNEPVEAQAAGLLLALAYPDRIALRRPGGEARFLLSGGRGARLLEGDDLSASDCLVAAVLDGAGRDAVIRLAAPLERADLEARLPELISEREQVSWDEGQGAAVARKERRLGALVLDSRPMDTVPPQAMTALLLQAIRERGLSCLPWTAENERLRERMAFMHRLAVAGGESAAWPEVSDAALLDTLEDWLGPWLTGMSRLSHLRRLDLSAALLGLLDWPRQQRLNSLAPERFTVPSGSGIRIDYSDPEAPVLAVRIQEVFGLTRTPMIGGDKVPLTLHLLSPAQRPVQVTRDLAGFWARTYGEVKKDLKGRYPKHYWPDDPMQAVAVRGVKRSGK